MTDIAEEEKRDPHIDRFRTSIQANAATDAREGEPDPYIDSFRNSPVSEVTREVVDQAFRAYKTARRLSLIGPYASFG